MSATGLEASASARDVGAHTRAFGYTIYGLRILSDFALPIVAERELPSEPDVVFRRIGPTEQLSAPRGQVLDEQRCVHGSPLYRVQRDGGEAWIWAASVATVHIHSDLRTVDVRVEANEDLLGLLLLGQVTVFIARHRGLVCLHASAVLTEHGAVAFFGPKGQGKSTMAAAFLRRGCALVTDDVLALESRGDRHLAVPGPRIMKLWQPSVDGTLELDEELPDLARLVPKKLLALDGRFESVERAVPVRAAYLLERTVGKSEPAIRPLTGQEAMATLLAQTSPSTYLTPREVANVLPIYRRLSSVIALRKLTFAEGFEHQSGIYTAVINDLQALG